MTHAIESMTREPETVTAFQDPGARRFVDGFRNHPQRYASDQPAHVLVVEDAPDIRKLMRFLVLTSGAHVTSVADGRSAAAMIDREPPPDLIVVDRMLPILSGDELIRMVRSDPLWRDTPILVVSAKAREEDVADSLNDGANAYLTKPFNPKRFIDTVERFI